MSTDYDVVCHTCKKVRHLGQRSASFYSFGFGSTDQEGANQAAQWMFRHMEENHTVTVQVTDSGLKRPSDDYQYVHDEKCPEDL